MVRAERRLFPRRDFRVGVYAYVDGRRYDGRSTNISAGGMFLATDEEIPLGHTIALVFKSKSGKKSADEKGVKYGAGIKGEPVFMVGRVMRKQAIPERGVGLRWVRAMTDADPQDLEYFLSRMLRIDARGAERKRVGANKAMRSVFEFEPLYQQAIKYGGVMETTSTTTGPILVGEEGTSEFFRELRFDDDFEGGSHSDGPSLPRERSKHGSSHRLAGPVTSRIRQAEKLMPANANGVMTVGPLPVPVRITALGLKGAFAESSVAPTDRREPVGLIIELVTRRQTEKIRCRARITGVDDGTGVGEPGVYVEFIEFAGDEGKETLEQYVRWLHMRNVSTPT